MKKEINYSIDKLNDAFLKLKEGVHQAKDELEKDGVIQRFEFTFEMAWKSLKIVLFKEGIDARTPKQCLKEAFRLVLIEEEKAFLDMLEDRNKMSHIYNQEEADKIFQRIKKDYVPALEQLAQKLKTTYRDKL